MATTYTLFQQTHDGTDIGAVGNYTTYQDAWNALEAANLANDGDQVIYVIRQS